MQGNLDVTTEWAEPIRTALEAMYEYREIERTTEVGQLIFQTSQRVARAWREMTEGYSMDPAVILDRLFACDTDDMVVLQGIRFTSMCEHHLLPFVGNATVAYIPCGKVVGISKLARLVECYSRRLQLQERMCREIASALQQYVPNTGVAVMLRAHHTCMGCRGARQMDASMVTSTMLGAFREHLTTREEVLKYCP